MVGDDLNPIALEFDAASGRVDAREVAESVGLSLDQIARLASVTEEVLSE